MLWDAMQILAGRDVGMIYESVLCISARSLNILPHSGKAAN